MICRTFHIALILLFVTISLSAQTGDFILTHHSPKHSEIDNVNFQITSDKNGIICIANRFGVLRYDGLEWDFYKTKSTAFSLAIVDDNTIYVGCVSEFGRLEHKDGSYQYQQLFSSDSVSDEFTQSFQVNEYVYFLSDKHLYAINHTTDDIVLVESGNFINGYLKDDVLFLNIEDGEVLSVLALKASPIKSPKHRWDIFKESPDGNQAVAMDISGTLFMVKEEETKLLAQNKKIKDAKLEVMQIGWVNDSLIACATLESGVFFLNTNDRSYFEITDYHSGLPDNEIHDLFTDAFGGVWVSHEFGLTRIDPLFPVHSYTTFPGLDGNLIEARRLKGDLWVNTSLGVYYFQQDSSFKNMVVRKEIKSQKEQKAKSDSKSEKKGFLRGIFKSKQRDKQSKENKGFLKKITTSFSKKEVQYERTVKRIMTGVSFQFHHVPGTDGKFRQLLELPSSILATSHDGLYEISKTNTEQVIEENVKYAYAVEGENKLLISTAEGFLKSYELRNNLWTITSEQHFPHVILNVYSDQKNRIWLAGTTHIYLVQFKGDVFEIIGGYQINNKFYDELSIWEHNNQIYFINSQGYFLLDEEAEKVVKEKKMAKEIGLPHHHIQNEKSRVWIFNGKFWNLLLPNGEIHEFAYLGIYPDLKYISYDQQTNKYWLITQDNQLLAYSADTKVENRDNYGLFIKRLSVKNGELKIQNELKLRHDQNELVIELLKPDYQGIRGHEYQYKLVGLQKEWSSWTRANLIDYSYIPSGNYELYVRVRDSFGQMEESKLLIFSVGTPYWKQPWFYGIQALLLVIIMAIISKLNEESKISRMFKHGLSILTLVVIIEFLQSVIGAYLGIRSSPVGDFLIDAGIAFTIFPLEWILRKVMIERDFSFMKRQRKT